MREVCGTYSEAPIDWNVVKCLPVDKTEGSSCIEEMVLLRNETKGPGKVEWNIGWTIAVFVYTDCLTLDPLPD
jgi:hypothetical protein